MYRPPVSFAFSGEKNDTVSAHINRPHYNDNGLPLTEYHFKDKQRVYPYMHGTLNAAGWAVQEFRVRRDPVFCMDELLY